MGEVKLIDVHGDLQRLRGEAIIPCNYCGNAFVDTSYQEVLPDIVVHVGPTDPEEWQGNHPLGLSGLSDNEVAFGFGCASELLEERALFLGRLNTLAISPAQIREYLEIWESYWTQPFR